METRRSLRVKKQDSEEKGSKKKSTEIANKGKEKKPNEKKPNESKPNEKKPNESNKKSSETINSGTNVNRKKVQENESAKNKNVIKPRIGLRKQTSNSDIINSSEYAEKEKVSELKNENKIVEKPSKRNKSKDEHKEAGNAKTGKKMETKTGKKMEANQTAINRGSINRGNVDRGSVDRGSINRGNVDRGSINRGSVDRGNVDRGNVDRGSVDRGNINRSIKRRLSQLLDRLKKEKLFQCLNDISDYSEIFIDNKEKKENEKDVEIVKCINTSLPKKINVDIIHSKLHYEMYKNENEFNNDILLLFDNSIDVIKLEKKKKRKKKII